MLSWMLLAAQAMGSGGEAYQLSLPAGMSDTDSVITPTNASAVVAVNSDGTWDEGGAEAGTWLVTGSGSDYECYLSGTGDTPTTGTMNTWLAMSSNRSWSMVQSGIGTKNFSGTLQIRIAATAVVVDTCNFTLNAEVGT